MLTAKEALEFSEKVEKKKLLQPVAQLIEESANNGKTQTNVVIHNNDVDVVLNELWRLGYVAYIVTASCSDSYTTFNVSWSKPQPVEKK